MDDDGKMDKDKDKNCTNDLFQEYERILKAMEEVEDQIKRLHDQSLRKNRDIWD